MEAYMLWFIAWLSVGTFEESRDRFIDFYTYTQGDRYGCTVDISDWSSDSTGALGLGYALGAQGQSLESVCAMNAATALDEMCNATVDPATQAHCATIGDYLDD